MGTKQLGTVTPRAEKHMGHAQDCSGFLPRGSFGDMEARCRTGEVEQIRATSLSQEDRD